MNTATIDVTSLCETPGCGKLAMLKCPTCLKLGLGGALFCSQSCFKEYWKEHRKVHGVAKQLNSLNIKTEDQCQKDNLVIWPGYHFSGNLRAHKQSATRIVSEHIQRPDYANDPSGIPLSEREAKSRNGHQMRVLDEAAQEAMRLTCRLAREVLEEAAAGVAVGVTTDELDRIVHEACMERECYPSPLNYYGFPKSCCTSVNEVICHGIPDMRPLCNGDIVNIDVTVYHRGYHGDLNETVYVGEVDDASRKLVETAHSCLWRAIELVRPGVRYRDIGDIVQRTAQQNDHSVVRTYCGHGIHELFHCSPNVPHYAKNKAVGVMKVGHCFTIEPMINAGTWHDDIWPDKWTAVTRDGRRSAQFEETLLVTESGVEVLTRRRERGGQPYFKD